MKKSLLKFSHKSHPRRSPRGYHCGSAYSVFIYGSIRLKYLFSNKRVCLLLGLLTATMHLCICSFPCLLNASLMPVPVWVL